MDVFSIIIILVLLAGFGILFFLFNKKFKELSEKQKNDQSMQLLNQNLQGMQSRLDNTNQNITQRLDSATKVIYGVQKELGHVQEIGRGLKDVSDFLKSPKLRGNIGEQVLRDLLEQYFSKDHFSMQYKFREGQMVDAIIKTDKGLIPIDAKFPMENYQKMSKCENEQEETLYRKNFWRDVKKHINDISKKYILPSEGTVDFAVMYVPSERVYYEIIGDNMDVTSYAYERKVFTVSPNSFYYFLKVIMIGMEGKKIEEASQKILETLNAISKDAQNFTAVLGVLTTHVTNAKSAVDRVNNEYSKLEGKIEQVKLLK